jgi:hypothetical protein
MQMGAPETLTVIGNAISSSSNGASKQQQQGQHDQPLQCSIDWLFEHMLTAALAQGHAMSLCKFMLHNLTLLVCTSSTDCSAYARMALTISNC